MRTIDFVTKESLRRLRKSIAGLLFILLGIGIFVACQTINKALHDRTKEQLLRFGANIIIQPKGEPFDLYSGTVKGGILIPEYYADKARTIEHSGMLVAVSPKLYERFEFSGRSLLVVGITPDEKKAKPWWLIGNSVLTDEFPMGKEILLGHYAAAHLGEDASQVKLGDETFRVSGVLDETGSPDDFMAYPATSNPFQAERCTKTRSHMRCDFAMLDIPYRRKTSPAKTRPRVITRRKH